MSGQDFHYLSPLIFPVFPADTGEVDMAFDLQRSIDADARAPVDAEIEAHLQLICDGELVSEERVGASVREGRIEPRHLVRSYTLPRLGYVQLTITADRPYFRAILTEQGYVFVRRPNGGVLTLDSAYKYSVQIITDQMRQTGSFCLVHPAQFVSAARDIGNSVLIVNPFDGPIVARMAIADGAEHRERIAARHACMIPLQVLLPDDRFTCVMYTGNNRYPAWDVRHALSDPTRIHRIDHIEYYRADPNMIYGSVVAATKAAARRALRNTGLWF